MPLSFTPIDDSGKPVSRPITYTPVPPTATEQVKQGDVKGGIDTALGNVFGPINRTLDSVLGSFGPGGNIPDALKALNAPETKISLAMPGAAAAGPLKGAISQGISKLAPRLLGQAGLQGAAQGVGSLVRGEGPLAAGKEALGGAGGTVAGGVLAKGINTPYKAFEGKTGRTLAKWAKDNIPAWSGFPTNAKGLHDMVKAEGPQALDKMFKGAKAQIPADHLTEVPVELAKAAKITGNRQPIPKTGRGEAPITTQVKTRELVDKLAELDGPEKHQVWTAIDKSLSGVPGKALQEARNQYRLGQGLIGFFKKSPSLNGERYDAARAMNDLSKYGQEFFGRGMGQAAGIIRGPGAETITRGTMEKPGALAGALAGLAGGGAALPGLGHMGGAVGGGYLGKHIGRMIPTTQNVPTGSVANFLKQLVTRGGASAGAQIGGTE
jgi:hypothetical protein